MDKVKLANCTPEGRFSVTTEIFEYHYWDLDLFSGTDDYEYWHLKIKQADYYTRDRSERWAIDIYRDVLNHTVKNGKILKEYKELAEAAYKGLVKLYHSSDEFVWESCESLLSYYTEVFEPDPQKP